MSVANILGADGKIKALYFPGGEYPSGGGVTNPLSANLQCAGFEVGGASYVRTNIVECETLEPKAPQTFVECVGDLVVAPTKAVDADTVRVDTLEARTSAVIETVNPLLVADALRVKGEFPLIQFEDLSGNDKGSVFVDTSANRMNVQLPSDTLYINSIVNPTIQLNAQGAPNMEVNIAYDVALDNLQIDKSVAISSGVDETLGLTYTGAIPASHGIVFKNTTDAFEGGFSYIHSGAAAGQFVLDRSTQIRDPGTNPRIFLIADGGSPVSNGQLVYDSSFQRMYVTRDFEVRGTGVAPTAGLRIGPLANQVALTYVQATNTLNVDKQVQFNNFAPSTIIPPIIGESLTNKTYVDGLATFKSTRMFYVSKQGNNISGNGSANAPFATIQKAILTAEALPGLSTNPVTILVDTGVYTETLTFTTGYVYIASYNGNSSTQGTTVINGSISISCGGANDIFNKMVSFTNIGIVGEILDNSTASHSISFMNCNIFFSGISQMSVDNTCPDARVYIKDCFINSSAGIAAVAVRVGQLYMNSTQISQSSTEECLFIASVANAALVNFNNFSNSNAGATLSPLVRIVSSSAAPHTFGGNTFSYAAPTVKTGAPNASGILFDGGLANQTAVITQNVFSLNGTSYPSNHAVMKSGTMVGVATALQANNYALLGADKFEASIVVSTGTLIS